MSKRTLRRAAERAAHKANRAAKLQNPTAAAPACEPVQNSEFQNLEIAAEEFVRATEAEQQSVPAARTTRQTSEAQIHANRQNSQKSAGPSTPAGRAKSAQNSLKHGLTGKTVVLPGEDQSEYDNALQTLIEAHQPATQEELRLVQSLLNCEWRLNRIMLLETSILFKGALEFKDKFDDKTPIERQHLINAETYLKYEKSLRNLNIQEARLRRTMDKDRAELKNLQIQRQREEYAAQQAQIKSPKPTPKPQPQPQNGFVFSTPQDESSNTPDQASKLHRSAA
jgi:hypothetical protein